MKPFVVTYRHEGQPYGLELHARDADDARARLRSLSFGTVEGELIGTLPAQLSFIGIVACAIRNVWARLVR